MEKSCCAGKTQANKQYIGDKVRLYLPLIVIVAISTLAAVALSMRGNITFMNSMMGMFLLFLASLKLFCLQKFADGFARYDLVAGRFRGYALSYPFIELALGCLYLSGLFPVATNTLTIVVMFIGTIGVAKVIRSGSIVQCACVGTGFNLPVGQVTLFENLAMATMAAINLLH